MEYTEDTCESLAEEYTRLAHAVQTGITALMGLEPSFTTPKHLRVGIDCAHADQFGLAKLLMEKGAFTSLEYHRAMRDAMLDEVKRFEKHLSETMKRPVHLA